MAGAAEVQRGNGSWGLTAAGADVGPGADTELAQWRDGGDAIHRDDPHLQRLPDRRIEQGLRIARREVAAAEDAVEAVLGGSAEGARAEARTGTRARTRG